MYPRTAQIEHYARGTVRVFQAVGQLVALARIPFAAYRDEEHRLTINASNERRRTQFLVDSLMMSEIRELRSGEFFGNVARRHEAGGVTLSVVRHAIERELPMHSHERAYFCLLIEYGPFSIALHPPQFSHSDRIGPLIPVARAADGT
ncbi:MAG: hypothetical protein ACXWNK_08400 [Vulcanimicrobiaceae bacterium]